MHQNCIAVVGPNYGFFPVRWRVETLQGKTRGLIEPVVVNFIQVNLGRRRVHVVFVGRIAGPVSPGGIYLNHYNFVSREAGLNDVHNLPRSVPAPAQSAGYVIWGDQARLELRLRWYSALGDFTGRFGPERDAISRWQIQAIGQAVENILSSANRLLALTPVCCSESP